jgi:hypothetical protein
MRNGTSLGQKSCRCSGINAIPIRYAPFADTFHLQTKKEEGF